MGDLSTVMFIYWTVGFEFFDSKFFASSGSSNSSIEFFFFVGIYSFKQVETVEMVDFLHAPAGYLGTWSNSTNSSENIWSLFLSNLLLAVLIFYISKPDKGEQSS